MKINMSHLTHKMQLRLDKWRSKEKVPTAKIITGFKNFISRKDYGDEFEEEVILQEQKNKENNGKSTNR